MSVLIQPVKKYLPLLLFGILATACQTKASDQPQSTRYDLLLQKVLVVDGTGSAAYAATVGILSDSIALIERDTSVSYRAKKVLDGRGLVLSPGFIDTHAHGDPLKGPDYNNFLSMGVTTICLGQDGFSPEWEDLSPWMVRVDSLRPGVNIALFAGHNTLRMLSGAAYEATPSAAQQAKMETLLSRALEAGCFGLTTGLEYTPGYYAGSAELNQLAKVVGRWKGLIMSHMRNEDDAYVNGSIRELLTQGRYCPVHVSHIKVVYGKGEKRAAEILQLLDSAREQGIQVTADYYPYTASYTGIGILFPDWAKKPHNYQQVVATRKKELLEFLKNKVVQRNGPEATLIGSGPYKGKTLRQISLELNKPFEQVLLEDIGPYGASGAYFIMDSALQESFLQDPNIMICTDGSASMNHPRGHGAFARILQTYVVNKQLLPLEEAVRKMSGLPAKVLGLADRGLIREGYKADLLLFAPADIRENATYEDPYRPATGFKCVIVNGKIAGEQDQPGAGKVLKKRS